MWRKEKTEKLDGKFLSTAGRLGICFAGLRRRHGKNLTMDRSPKLEVCFRTNHITSFRNTLPGFPSEEDFIFVTKVSEAL
jgi:hypothetical protein